MPTYQETVDKYEKDLAKLANDIKVTADAMEQDRKAIKLAEEKLGAMQKLLPRLEAEKIKDKITSTKASIAKYEKEIKTLKEAKTKRKTNHEVLTKKHKQMSDQVATFKHEQRNRPKTENVSAATMQEWEKLYFPLLKKLDLGLGDTVKNLEKLIADRGKAKEALKAEDKKLLAEIQKHIEKGEDDKALVKKARAQKIPGEKIVLDQEIKILTARRDEYRTEKANLKAQLANKTITKEKYDKAKARLQAIAKLAVQK